MVLRIVLARELRNVISAVCAVCTNSHSAGLASSAMALVEKKTAAVIATSDCRDFIKFIPLCELDAL